MKSLNDVFSNWINSGIFKNLTDNFDVPWKETIDGSILDLDYHGNRSGAKLISPLIFKLLDENEELTNANILKICNLIFIKYGLNWEKLWATLSLEYNPIENYSMIETEESNGTNGELIEETTGGKDTIKETGTDTLSKSNSTNATNTIENEGNDTTETTGTTTTENSVYGFNSSTAVGDNTSTTTPDTTETTTYGKTETETITQTDTGTDTQTKNLQNETTYGRTNNIDRSGSSSNERTLTRAGNIGVTTSQQMIESERELWIWNFFNQVFEDVDSITVLKVFKNDFC